MNDHAYMKELEEIFYHALRSVDPYASVRAYTDKVRTAYQRGGFSSLLVVGFGKAAFPMALAVEVSLGDLISAGTVITKYGHAKAGVRKDNAQGPESLQKIRVIEAGHPVPDMNGSKGAEEIMDLLRAADERTLVVCLISGGGSALLASPHEGISLAEKQEMTGLLLKAGADIFELNTVRKHISRVKGGRLAKLAHPARLISLIISDVIGDSLDVIASGATSPDTSTYQAALAVLRKYGLMGKTPRSILRILEQGAEGLIPETPKHDDSVFRNTENIIISSNRTAINAAREQAARMGLHTEILSYELSGEARDAGQWLAQEAQKRKSSTTQRPEGPLCLISGGETTVTVKGSGLGGRNTELALAFAMSIDGLGGITFLSAGTDGTDGPTDAAGAIVDGNTVQKARTAGADPAEYLRNNDSYNFFKKAGGLFITGPTGTNVMDLQVMIVL